MSLSPNPKSSVPSPPRTPTPEPPDLSDIEDLPPSYAETALATENPIWKPTILLLNNTTIHAHATTSPPLYKLSRSPTHINHATDSVTLSRIEHVARPTSPGSPSPSGPSEPRIKARPRHIYTIVHLKKIPGGLGASVDGVQFPQVWMQAASRRTLGHLGVRRSRLRVGRTVKVWPVEVGVKWTGGNWGMPVWGRAVKEEKDEDGETKEKDKGKGKQKKKKKGELEKGGKAVFVIHPTGEGAVWEDGGGRVIAREEKSEEGIEKLVVEKELEREVVDAMVGVWCGRLWQRSAESVERVHEGMEGVYRKFRLAKEFGIGKGPMKGGFGGAAA